MYVYRSEKTFNDIVYALKEIKILLVLSQRERTNVFIQVIQNTFGSLTNQFKETLTDLVSPFLKAFYSVFNAVKAVKSGYTSVRNT